MLSRVQYNVQMGFGVAALLLVIANCVLVTQNRSAQQRLNERQQFLQQTVPLQGLYTEIVKALAEMAVKGNDRQVLDMLAAQGINVTANPPTPTPSDPATTKNDK